jgi:hypothetical protein
MPLAWGPPSALAAREGHEVCTFRREAPEVRLRRQLRSGVDNDGHAMPMRRSRYVGERRSRISVGNIDDGRGAVGDRVFDFPYLRVADTRSCISVRKAHLDDAEPRGADGVVVEIVLAPHRNGFVLHA